MQENLKKSEEQADVGGYHILFGKYKNTKTFREIFDEDKPYVAYLIECLDYDRNRFFLDYWMELICDSDEVIEKKKQTRTRKKKEVVKDTVEEEQ
jgi:hypothetical protein